METPVLSHIQESDYEFVYEPAEDSFLMLDALESEIENISKSQPTVCLEIGSGSGINITAFAKVFPSCFCIGVDINPKACSISFATSKKNDTNIDCINMDLATCLKGNMADVVIFNPPYVVTESLEIVQSDISRAWAGGIKGRQVIDRFLAMLPQILSAEGVCYMLVIQENLPDEIQEILKRLGYTSTSVIKRKAYNEKLQVLKITKY